MRNKKKKKQEGNEKKIEIVNDERWRRRGSEHHYVYIVYEILARKRSILTCQYIGSIERMQCRRHHRQANVHVDLK